ncbi:MFS general substrate transporter [Ceraceosorus guamensis]|uniref:MFS general substrate transporter n=1 Tax=Ceraceosorus guamensis TaxID=1522189 RepID=A0A316VUI2_9BASI|nr:MFS general substrate transporter [Ceraceosorus guamensis]PWN39921.1 MFS general substrate transporter [Ceraceosorus guamensis]
MAWWPFRRSGAGEAEAEQERRGLLQHPSERRRASDHHHVHHRGSRADSHSHSDSHSDSSAKATPLPKMQLFILCVMRLSEPIAFTCIFPFIPYMLHDNLPDVPKDEIGYYAGLVESLFAVVQFLTGMVWGSLSDRIGRKPVLLIGLAGTFVSVNAFGLAKSFHAMILARAINGLMNGNIAVIKSVLGELTDDSNQARAFTFLPLMFAIGSIIGPAIGGTLSDPASTFPDWFGRSQFLKRYPYWLPCGVAGLLNLFGLLVGFLFLQENSDERASHNQPAAPSPITDDEEKPASFKEIFKPKILTVLFNQALINLINVAYMSALPLFCFTPIEKGGLDFTKQDVGTILAANGVLAIFIQLFLFPFLEKRLGGPQHVLKRSLPFMASTFLFFPLAHVAARLGRAEVWTVLGAMLVFKSIGGISIVSGTLCINNVAPNRASLGRVNGLGQSLGSLSRAVGPISSTSLFAWSITHPQFLDGQLVWIAFFLVSGCRRCAVCAFVAPTDGWSSKLDRMPQLAFGTW